MSELDSSHKTHLQLVLTFHQPLSATEDDCARALERCYRPVLDVLERHEHTHVGMHWSGHLLDYLASHDEAILQRIKNLVRKGKAEVLGGLFYGSPPALLSELDVRGQVQMCAEYWESLLGRAPTGYWLQELAWSVDMPRLLSDSGLEYGFVSASQLDAPAHGGMVTLQRGGEHTCAMVLDDELSANLPMAEPEAWLGAVVDRGARASGNTVAVWLRAETLGLDAHSYEHCIAGGWLDRFIATVGRSAQLVTILPAAAFALARPARPARLSERCAPAVHACGPKGEATEWLGFVHDVKEVADLHGRMLRVSDKLREAIGAMEDEGLEDEWSDTLATAQRHVFSAQSPDAYWRDARAGYSSVEERDAAIARLMQAERAIDALSQGEDDWLTNEEQDRDNDMVDEIYITTRLLSVCVAPAAGCVRAVDARLHNRTLLDVSARRAEPFFAAMATAPQHAPAKVAARGTHLARLDTQLPTGVDALPIDGIRIRVVRNPEPTEELTADSDALQGLAWQLLDNRVDEEGDCSCSVVLQSEAANGKPGARLAVRVPIDDARLEVDASAHWEGHSHGFMVVEVPLRWLPAAGVRVQGDVVSKGTHRQDATSRVEIRGDEAAAAGLAISLDKQATLICEAVQVTVRDLDGYRARPGGHLLRYWVPLGSEAQLHLTLSVDAPPAR